MTFEYGARFGAAFPGTALRRRASTGAAVMLVAAAVSLLCAPLVSAQVAPPDLPQVTPVMLDPATTAFLVLDINSAVCPPRPACVASVPNISRLLARARDAGVFVGYSTTAGADVLADVAKRPGIQTVLMVGAAANGAVLYTAFGAVERGYTVAVAVDGISSGPDFDTFLAQYQVLNMPGFANATNDPLKPMAATLTRSDMVSFNTVAK